MLFIVPFLFGRFKNEPSVDKDEDSLGLWKTKTRVPHLDKAFGEVSLRSSNEHAGRAGLQLDGLVAKQEKTLFVRRKCEQPNSS